MERTVAYNTEHLTEQTRGREGVLVAVNTRTVAYNAQQRAAEAKQSAIALDQCKIPIRSGMRLEIK